jgi:Na+-transporting methylmalonyl-CoA/oxaloacetate decarboxylase beta subunit
MTSGTASLRTETILTFMPGVVTFSLDIVAGVLLGKLTSVLLERKINPVIGACRISAFHMSSGVVKKLGWGNNPHNHPLMHGVGANTAGQIASVMAGEVMLLLVPMFS